MSTISTPAVRSRTPWHVWVVGALTLLWNGSGAYTILMAQAGRLSDVGPEEAAYYAAQPLWLVLATDIALFAPIAGGIALLLRSRTAVWFFAISVAAVVLTNGYELAAGTSLALVERNWVVVEGVVLTIAVLQLVYALAMKRRGVLV